MVVSAFEAGNRNKLGFLEFVAEIVQRLETEERWVSAQIGVEILVEAAARMAEIEPQDSSMGRPRSVPSFEPKFFFD